MGAIAQLFWADNDPLILWFSSAISLAVLEECDRCTHDDMEEGALRYT